MERGVFVCEEQGAGWGTCCEECCGARGAAMATWAGGCDAVPYGGVRRCAGRRGYCGVPAGVPALYRGAAALAPPGCLGRGALRCALASCAVARAAHLRTCMGRRCTGMEAVVKLWSG